MLNAVEPMAAIPELDIQPGEHVIALMSQHSDVDALFKYLEQMERETSEGIVVAAPGQQAEVKNKLDQHDICCPSEALHLHDPLQMGMKDGKFDAEHFLSQTNAAVGKLIDAGAPRIYHSGIMRWLNDAEVPEDEAIYLEARINQNIEGTCMSGFCIYDVSSIGSHLLMQLLRTHPKVLMDHQIVENPFYERPENVIRDLGRA